MEMTLLGTGTSHGIPCIACNCKVCTSTDAKDKRLRSSAYLVHTNEEGKTAHILIDIGPEFRIQALRSKITAVDAVLLTHSHADHLHGLDDIRVFSHTKAQEAKGPEGTPLQLIESTNENGISIYANKNTLNDVKNRFDYIFKETQIGGGKPKLQLKDASIFENGKNSPKEFCNLSVTPLPMLHGTIQTTGYLFCANKNAIAYMTDCSNVPKETILLIKEVLKQNNANLIHLVIDALREKPHSTHFSFRQALDVAEQLCPKNTYFTHICHRMSHKEIESYAKNALSDYPNLSKIVESGGTVEPAYDEQILKT